MAKRRGSRGLTVPGVSVYNADKRDRQYQTVVGLTSLNNVSGGTQVISTGLSTVSYFSGIPYHKTSGNISRTTGQYFVQIMGYGSNGGVTLAVHDNSGASVSYGTSGVSLSWFALGI